MRVALLGNGRPAAAALAALEDAGAEIVPLIDTGRVNIAALRAYRPELGLTVGYRYLLDAETIAIPPLGWFNIHSSLLPTYKGFAPLNWAILNGERTLGVTLHRIDETVDGGAIVFQESFTLKPDRDVGDALAICEPIYGRMVRQLMGILREAKPSAAGGLPWPARTDADGEIDWEQPAEEIVNLIRACAPPYQGAWTMVGGRKLRILKARVD